MVTLISFQRPAKVHKKLMFHYLLLTFSLFGCATLEELEKYDIKSSPGTDLNGNWIFFGNFNENKKIIAKAINKTNGVIYRGIKTTGMFDGNSTPTIKKNSRGVAHLFFENTQKIKVTQTKYSLYINFDRSIVEEYSFGELKTIVLGNVKARRSSGWVKDKGVYRIETLDEYGMKITEEYKLLINEEKLERLLIFRDKDLNEIKVLQTYIRKN